MNSPDLTKYRLTSPAMRLMLVIAAILVFSVGITLNMLTEQTDRFFAWTIAAPMTAAFLGAAYWSSCVLELLAARQRIWVNARIAVPTVLIFTVLTLIVTLIHNDRFHFNAPDMMTRMGTWFWLLVYAVVPVVMGAIWLLQLRVPGIDPPRTHPATGWLRVLSAVQAIILLAFGTALLLAPEAVAPYWPWALTPLTGRAIGAWLFAIGFAAASSVWENDLRRLRIAFISYTAIGVLELIALIRYSSTMTWTSASAWLYLVFLFSLIFVGAVSWYLSHQMEN